MVAVQAGVHMRFGGSLAPAASLELLSIGRLGEEENKGYRCAPLPSLCAMLALGRGETTFGCRGGRALLWEEHCCDCCSASPPLYRPPPSFPLSLCYLSADSEWRRLFGELELTYAALGCASCCRMRQECRQTVFTSDSLM